MVRTVGLDPTYEGSNPSTPSTITGHIYDLGGFPIVTFYTDHAVVYLPTDKNAPGWKVLRDWLDEGHEGDEAWLHVWLDDVIGPYPGERWTIEHVSTGEDGFAPFLRVTNNVQAMTKDEWEELYGV